jgi:hypothetical protein
LVGEKFRKAGRFVGKGSHREISVAESNQPPKNELTFRDVQKEEEGER